MSNMKQITTAKGTYLFVEIPNTLIDDRYFTLWSDTENSFIIEFQCQIGDLYFSLETENNCQIISTTNQITEEQAESIVDTPFNNKYYQYLANGMMRVASMKHAYPYETAKESLQSLIKANGLDETKNYLILKKIE